MEETKIITTELGKYCNELRKSVRDWNLGYSKERHRSRNQKSESSRTEIKRHRTAGEEKIMNTRGNKNSVHAFRLVIRYSGEWEHILRRQVQSSTHQRKLQARMAIQLRVSCASPPPVTTRYVNPVRWHSIRSLYVFPVLCHLVKSFSKRR